MAFFRAIVSYFRKENDEEVDYCCMAKCCVLGPKARDVVDGIACEKCLSFCDCYCRCKVWMSSSEYDELKKKRGLEFII